jgi:aminomuconate-semialdehyde/2-hydroxymuconate-6-semialdehyde dehydrogenase
MTKSNSLVTTGVQNPSSPLAASEILLPSEILPTREDFLFIDSEFRAGPASPLDFVKALQSAKMAQEKVRKLTSEERAQFLYRWSEKIDQEKESLVEAESRSSGLPRDFILREILEASQNLLQELSADVRKTSLSSSSPTGVIAMWGPRSLGFLRLTSWIAKAFAAGNSVLVRPHPHSLESARRLGQILQSLDVPNGVVQILSGPDSELGPLLSGHPGVQAFLYSGSAAGAESLMTEVSRTKKKAQFFLGAKNSALVLPEFDFRDGMTHLLRPALIGAGQLDVNTHRYFIHQSVEKDFYGELQNYLQAHRTQFKLNFFDPSHQEIYDKAKGRVQVDEGHFIIKGTSSWTRDLPQCSELQQEDIPGPLFIITAVKYVHEMVKWSQAGEYGHSALIWGPQEKARQLAAQLQVGQVLINQWTGFVRWASPIKRSFWGNPDGRWSGSFFSDVKNMWLT